MQHINGAAVSANPLGDCKFSDQGGSQNKRDVGYEAEDVHPKLVYLAMNFSVFTVSNDKLCSERISGSVEGCDYHGRLDAVTAAKFQKQAGLHGIDVQPQDRLVVGGGVAPALISYNVTCFGWSVEENHQSVCTELQQPWEEEQLLAAAIALSPAKLAAKSGSYVAAALSAGGAEQLVAAATTLSRAELVDKPHHYLLAMARASEQCDGADGVTDGIYKGFAGSPKHVLADYIVETRQIRQGELLAKQQGRAPGELLAEQQGEILLLLAKQQGEMQSTLH